MIELDSQLIRAKDQGKEVAISGNAAIARGLIEAGAKVITSYPGTPCAEIIENLVPLCNTYKFHIEWSINEKVAFEVAAAAAMSGVRSAFITKHVGMNVVSDSLMPICYAGVNGGMVIISADDPGAFDSPIEQDTRFYARMSEILGIEASNQQEAKDMVIRALEISEKVKLPVFIRATNRIFYGRGKVITDKIQDRENNIRFERENFRWFIAGRNAVKRHQWLHKQQGQLKNIAETFPFNNIEWSAQKKYGIIATGVGYYYAKEVIKDLSLKNYISILKIGCFNPLPESYIKQFLNGVEEVLIVEELEPFIEEGVKRIAHEGNKKIKIYGKLSYHFPHTDAFSPEMIRDVMVQLWLDQRDVFSTKEVSKKEEIMRRSQELAKSLPDNYISFCPGCPHRASFYVLKRTLKNTHEQFIVTGDIGCYLLGARHPFSLVDTVFCMGASIGIACGFYQAKVKQRVIAIIGDSTFLHAGIPALINCCYTDVDILIYIVDNRTVAMTGLQPYPGTGINAEGEETKKINLEDIVKACKVDYLRIIDPFNVKKAEKVLSQALKMRGQRVVIAQHECAQVMRKNYRQKNRKIKTYKIDYQKCKQCKICIRVLDCPAILVRNNKVFISQFLCSGCDLCRQVCPYNAIILEKKQ